MEISSERIDDIPLVAALLNQMEVAKWIDQQLKQPHGNHQGLSYGQLSVLLLIYIISQSDHRLCVAETWVKTHRITLELVTGWSIGEKDVTDDRLARVVEQFGWQGEACQEIEQKLGKHLIRAYELPTEVVRLDTTSFTVHHEQIESEADSLLRYGYSKDKRPDLRQYRQMLGTVDPNGIPLVSETLPGNGADDPLYWPAWQRMVKVIGHKLFVFLADCKAAAIATRAQIANQGGIYCFPLPLTGQNPALLKQWVLDPPSASIDIRLPRQEDNEPAVGKGFEVELGKFWLNPDTKKQVTWHERYLVTYSHILAAAQIRGLDERIDKAQLALGKLKQTPGEDLEVLNTKVKSILKRHRVKEFLMVTTLHPKLIFKPLI
jgi:transposase